jgi:formyl-CoA transferase
MSLYGGIMTALWARERTGEGRRVTTSLFANGLWSNGMMASMALCGAEIPLRDPEAAIVNALAVQYETADQRWLQLTLLNEEREWPRLLTALELENLATDERFLEREHRRENAAALHQILAGRFIQLTGPDARARLGDAGIPAAALTTVADIPEDAQAIAADVLTPVASPRPGWERTVSSPLWIEGARKRAPEYAADLGRDTEAVLGELGLDVAALRDAGVIG